MQSKCNSALQHIFQKAEEEKFYKDLRDNLKKEYRRKKIISNKGKVSGEEMLNLLKLNNFGKYEQNFLLDDNSNTYHTQKGSEKNEMLEIESEMEKFQNGVKEDEKDDSDSLMSEKDDYKSMKPQNL